MVKTILVPVDFTVESLNTLKLALSKNEEHEVYALLLHAKLPPDSISELLFYSPQKEINALTNPNFEKALDVLMNKYDKVFRDAKIELLHSKSGALLRNIINANKVNEVYIPKNYRLKTQKRSFDPTPLLKKSGCPVFEMKWEPVMLGNEMDGLDALFTY